MDLGKKLFEIIKPMFLFYLMITDFPQLHQRRVTFCFWGSDWKHFCLSSKWMTLYYFLNITKIPSYWIERVKLVFSSSGFAHCSVLQQRDVNPLLFGDNAVAHFKGIERFTCLLTASEVPVGLGVYCLRLQCHTMTRSHVFLSTQISWVMQITMGTSPTETLSVAGNIFVGQVLWAKLDVFATLLWH